MMLHNNESVKLCPPAASSQLSSCHLISSHQDTHRIESPAKQRAQDSCANFRVQGAKEGAPDHIVKSLSKQLAQLSFKLH